VDTGTRRQTINNCSTSVSVDCLWFVLKLPAANSIAFLLFRSFIRYYDFPTYHRTHRLFLHEDNNLDVKFMF